MKTDLLKFSESGGCSAKIPPRQLEEILKDFPVPADPDILVNIDTHDDAGVYRLNDGIALVVTTDYFPPVCSDPYEFGQIAAANSISDVYAMGGTPLIALNIMMFPAEKLSVDVYSEILRGGYDKAQEAGVRIIGGHTIDDAVPKYGLSVVGTVHPDKIITNSGARPGDALILTKPLGTGIILAGHRIGLASDEDLEEAKRLMKMLNSSGGEIMKKYGVKGATDITGFGLAGHALKMARASNVSINIKTNELPLTGNTLSLADDGCLPGACFTNLDYVSGDMDCEPGLDYSLRMVTFDAQTSGGLLICCPEDKAVSILGDLHSCGMGYSKIVGTVTEKKEKYLYLES